MKVYVVNKHTGEVVKNYVGVVAIHEKEEFFIITTLGSVKAHSKRNFKLSVYSLK